MSEIRDPIVVHIEGEDIDTGIMLFTGADAAAKADAWVISQVRASIREELDATPTTPYYQNARDALHDGLAITDATEAIEFADGWWGLQFHYGPDEINPEPLDNFSS